MENINVNQCPSVVYPEVLAQKFMVRICRVNLPVTIYQAGFQKDRKYHAMFYKYRTAFFSDIHSNFEALTVLEDIDRQEITNLSD